MFIDMPASSITGMKCFVIKYYLIFIVVATLVGCTKVTQTQTTPGGGDTQSTVKVDTPVKTKPTVADSIGWFSKALYIKLADPSGQPISNVSVAISNCILDTTPVSISVASCSLVNSWQTDANGTIFIDSSVNLAIPGRGLRFTLSKENYWTDSSGFLPVQPGFYKVDTLTFTFYAVSWLKVHVQDSSTVGSGQIDMYFTPDWSLGPGQVPLPPMPPSSNTNIYFNPDPQLLIGYQDHLKYLSANENSTFFIKTCGLTLNEISIFQYVGFSGTQNLYGGTQIVNNFDTLDWEIKF